MARRQAYLYSLVVGITLLIVVGVVSSIATNFSDNQSSSQYVEDMSAPIEPPPYTEEIRVYLAESDGFQYLISYTDRGFEPLRANVEVGNTVRFTNNSHRNLWIAAGGASIYPPEANNCGSSALDSCRALAPGEFWEFTFEKDGIWTVVNSFDKEKTTIVEVIQL